MTKLERLIRPIVAVADDRWADSEVAFARKTGICRYDTAKDLKIWVHDLEIPHWKVTDGTRRSRRLEGDRVELYKPPKPTAPARTESRLRHFVNAVCKWGAR